MNLSQNNLIKTYLVLAFGILAIASSPVILRLANAPGPVTSFYRMAIAVVILTAPFIRHVRKAGKLSRSGMLFAAGAGLFFALDLAAWSTGVMLAGASLPTLMANTAPVWVGIGAMIFLKEKLDIRFWVGLGISILGSAVILGVAPLRPAEFSTGALYGLLAAVFYGAYFLFTQRARETLDALPAFWLASFVSAAVLWIGVKWVFKQSLVGYPPKTYLYFLVMGIVIQSVGWLAISYALGKLPASIVSPTLLLQPAFTVFLAGPVLGEYFSPTQLAGVFIVLAGILMIHYSRQNTSHSMDKDNE